MTHCNGIYEFRGISASDLPVFAWIALFQLIKGEEEAAATESIKNASYAITKHSKVPDLSGATSLDPWAVTKEEIFPPEDARNLAEDYYRSHQRK